MTLGHNAHTVLCMQGNSPLHMAAQWGCPEAVQLLLSHGADADSRSDEVAAYNSPLAQCDAESRLPS